MPRKARPFLLCHSALELDACCKHCTRAFIYRCVKLGSAVGSLAVSRTEKQVYLATTHIDAKANSRTKPERYRCCLLAAILLVLFACRVQPCASAKVRGACQPTEVWDAGGAVQPLFDQASAAAAGSGRAMK
jgi:hypothetical protein